jgi:nucleoside-diphosphate-sugar epimerase
MEKAVVTGGAGFIGSHLVDALLARGYRVTVIDDLSTGRSNNIAHARGSIELIEGSILQEGVLARSFASATYVFHQAAVPSVPKSVKDPLTSHESNATGTLKVLLAARAAGVRRVIYAGSSSYYGDTPTLPKREDMPPNPQSPYALQKYAGEVYMRQFHHLYGLETVVLRYFNVYGPRQNPDSEYAAVIPRFLRRLTRGEAPIVFGDGTTTRDFTYVSDCVEANVAAAKAPGAAGRAFNIAGGRQVSLNELLHELQAFLGTSIDPVYQDFRAGDVKHSFADISQAREVLGYTPRVPLSKGLRLVAQSL